MRSEGVIARAHYRELLRLNPNDNQGIRYVLLHCYLERGDDESLAALLAHREYKYDGMAAWLYPKALGTLRRRGATRETNRALDDALGANPHVPAYLLGRKRIPSDLHDYVGLGDETEAFSYAAAAIKLWERTPGALKWLAEQAGDVVASLESVTDCPLCRSEDRPILCANEHAVVIPDKYPVADGHVLVVPKRHLSSVFDATTEELAAVWELVDVARRSLARTHRPDGFTIGVNDGEAAGQTVMHGHIHVIPRRRGDVADPRGGIRRVIAEKACHRNGFEASDGPGR